MLNPHLATHFARHLVGKMEIQAAHACSSSTSKSLGRPCWHRCRCSSSILHCMLHCHRHGFSSDVFLVEEICLFFCFFLGGVLRFSHLAPYTEYNQQLGILEYSNWENGKILRSLLQSKEVEIGSLLRSLVSLQKISSAP